MTQTKQKATRKLTEMTFEHADAAVALVGPAVGGAANGYPTLVYKGVKFSDETIAKASKIKLTMDIQDFLTKFYYLYSEEAIVLAQALGFDTTRDDVNLETYEDYIASQVSAIEVIKSLADAANIQEALVGLNEDQYLAFLQDQSKLEKAFKKVDKQAKESATTSGATPEASSDASTNASVENPVGPSGSEVVKQKENRMTKAVKVTEQDVTVEVVEKAQFDLVQKALDEQKVQLEKALAVVAQFEKEKQEAIVKAKTDSVKSLVKDEKQAEAVLKAVLALDTQADVDALLGVFKSMNELVEKSALFNEQGASVSDDAAPETESLVMKMAKAKYAKSTK